MMSERAQLLYFHLRANEEDEEDEGHGRLCEYVAIMRITGCGDVELNELIENDFIHKNNNYTVRVM